MVSDTYVHVVEKNIKLVASSQNEVSSTTLPLAYWPKYCQREETLYP